MSWVLILAGKAAEIVAQKVADVAPRKIRGLLAGDENKKALARSVKWGVLCMVQEWADLGVEVSEALKGTLESFFAEPDVTRELSKLLAGDDWDEAELCGIFVECVAEQDRKDDFPVTQGLGIFKAAFIANALREEVFQEYIKTSNILKHTGMLQAIRAPIEKIPALLEAIDEKLSAGQPQHARDINAENVVSGVQVIVQHLNGTTIPADELEAQYLNAFCDQCDVLDLSITDDKYTPDRKAAVGLSDVFARLYLEGITRYGDGSAKDTILGRGSRSTVSRSTPDREREAKPVTAIEAIAAVDRLAITGLPGGGKSTLVNYLFVQFARARLKRKSSVETVDHWPGSPLLPVRIILRKFAREIPDDCTTGEAGLVWDYIDTMIKGKKGRNCPPEVCRYVRRTLEQEGGIVFFDGLDEVGYGDAVSKRQIIKQAVEDFSTQLKKAKIVLTSRPYAYRSEDAWRLPEHLFPVVHLALFNKDQVKAFAENWYGKVGTAVKGWDEPYCADVTRDFHRAVDTRPRLLPIVQNPLLLTMAVGVHCQIGYLPKKRADLYEKVVMLLLARRENSIIRDAEEVEPEQDTDSILRLQLSAQKLLTPIAHVAYNCHCEQLASGQGGSEAADISRAALIGEFGEAFGYDVAERIIAYIEYRASILQSKDSRTYSLMHRTFQEYLAARHILELDDFAEVIWQSLEDNMDWWREVFLLMAGSARTRRASTIRDLVELLVNEKKVIGDLAGDVDFDRLWLAAQTLWETDYLDDCVGGRGAKAPHRQIFDKVHALLQEGLTADSELAPTRRVEAGHWLARLGDHRMHVLDAGQMKFCPVPAGVFTLGDGKDNDCPQHACELPYDYHLAAYPVTVAQYLQFDEAGGYRKAEYWTELADEELWRSGGQVKFLGDEDWRSGMPTLDSRFDYANHPMVDVSWFESLAFCRWLTDYFRAGKAVNGDIAKLIQDGWRFLLPSEAEWEKAARGAEGQRVYPCGKDIDANRANYAKTDSGATSAVGCFPGDESACHCFDMTGNVSEWCRNVKAGYPYECDEREQVHGKKGSSRVFRGGSWIDPAESCRCSFRDGDSPGLPDR